jgi:hypothetical protein
MIEFTVKVAATIVVPSAAHMIAVGDVVGADVPTEGYLKIDPMVLTKRYGMLSPRALVAAGRQVLVVICNPLPVDVKLFRSLRSGQRASQKWMTHRPRICDLADCVIQVQTPTR